MFPSYRNQSVDLLCKSTNWFLYDGNLVVKGLIEINSFSPFLITLGALKFEIANKVRERLLAQNLNLYEKKS